MEGLLKDFAIEIEILWEMIREKLREKLRTPQNT